LLSQTYWQPDPHGTSYAPVTSFQQAPADYRSLPTGNYFTDEQISNLGQADNVLKELVNSFVQNEIRVGNDLWRWHFPRSNEPFTGDNLGKVLQATKRVAVLLKQHATSDQQQSILEIENRLTAHEIRLQSYLGQSTGASTSSNIPGQSLIPAGRGVREHSQEPGQANFRPGPGNSPRR
jgi:hypothetical protein